MCRLEGSSLLKPNSDNRFLIQQISFLASTAAEYSASVDDSVMIFCSLDDQLTALVPILMMYPPVDHLLSFHLPWSASEKVMNGLFDVLSGLYVSVWLAVPCR